MAQPTVLDRQPASPPTTPAAPAWARRGRSGGDRAACREVLRQLDAWCRRHDAPAGLNAWVAEEAVRRA